MNNFKLNRNEILNNIEYNSLVILYSGALKQASADESYPFKVNMNFYNLTGIKQDNVYYLCKKINGKIEEHLFIYKNDPVKIRWIGAYLYEDEAKEIADINNIHYVDEFNSYVTKILLSKKIKYVYLDLEKPDFAGQINFGYQLKDKVNAIDFSK